MRRLLARLLDALSGRSVRISRAWANRPCGSFAERLARQTAAECRHQWPGSDGVCQSCIAAAVRTTIDEGIFRIEQRQRPPAHVTLDRRDGWDQATARMLEALRELAW